MTGRERRFKAYHLLVEVRDTNGADLLLGQLGHGLPGLRDSDALVKSGLAIVALLQGEELVTVLESDWPVDQPELLAVSCISASYCDLNLRQGTRDQAPRGSHRGHQQPPRDGACCSRAFR